MRHLESREQNAATTRGRFRGQLSVFDYYVTKSFIPFKIQTVINLVDGRLQLSVQRPPSSPELHISVLRTT